MRAFAGGHARRDCGASHWLQEIFCALRCCHTYLFDGERWQDRCLVTDNADDSQEALSKVIAAQLLNFLRFLNCDVLTRHRSNTQSVGRHSHVAIYLQRTHG